MHTKKSISDLETVYGDISNVWPQSSTQLSKYLPGTKGLVEPGNKTWMPMDAAYFERVQYYY